MKIGKIDNLGRVVIPIAFRKALNIRNDSHIKIVLNNESVIITPYENVCKLCGSSLENDGRFQICEKCVEEIKGI